MSRKRRALVLDTSAFIAGFDPSTVNEETYTVPEVGLELIDESTPKLRFTTSVEGGRLTVINPLPKYIDLVKSISEKTGDSSALSETDILVLALAVQLEDSGYEAVVVTDDYSIQNTAEKIGLKYTPLANFGIRYQFRWIIRCPACGRIKPPDQKEMICRYCGTQLERRPKKGGPAKRRA
ncbi:MAG: NOB1 family endonuclease [Candidatus Bathyarchaeia archaeon]